LKLGVLSPSPGQSPTGTSIERGADLAVKQLNENGGVNGRDVELIKKDTEAEASTAKQRYQELLLGEGVQATFGVFTSEVLLTLMDEIAEQGKIHMTTGAATPQSATQVSDNYEQYKYYFRTGPLNAVQLGQNMLDFAEGIFEDIGWSDVALIAEDYEWTRPIYNMLEGGLADRNINVALKQRYSSDTENFSPIYDDISNSGADAAFISMAHTGVPAIVQWARDRRQWGLGGIHVPGQLPSFYQQSEGAAAYSVTQNVATPQSEITQKTQPFVQAYRNEYDSLPVYTGYITFDAVKQWATVAQNEGTVDTDTVVGGLERSSYTGTTGTIEYHNKGHRFAHDVIYSPGKVDPVYQQWQPEDPTDIGAGGSQEVIYPTQYKTADYQQPIWIQ
jgi:branched-chain amino acid transport system substrate-binding protein